jgi:hypothetical protein
MCRSEVAAAPDFISRIGIPTTEEALRTSAKAWNALIPSLPLVDEPPAASDFQRERELLLERVQIAELQRETAELHRATAERERAAAERERAAAERQRDLVIAELNLRARLQAERDRCTAESLIERERSIAEACLQVVDRHQLTVAPPSSVSAPSALAVPQSNSTRRVKRVLTNSIVEDGLLAPRKKYNKCSKEHRQRLTCRAFKSINALVGGSQQGRVDVAAKLVGSPSGSSWKKLMATKKLQGRLGVAFKKDVLNFQRSEKTVCVSNCVLVFTCNAN